MRFQVWVNVSLIGQNGASQGTSFWAEVYRGNNQEPPGLPFEELKVHYERRIRADFVQRLKELLAHQLPETITYVRAIRYPPAGIDIDLEVLTRPPPYLRLSAAIFKGLLEPLVPEAIEAAIGKVPPVKISVNVREQQELSQSDAEQVQTAQPVHRWIVDTAAPLLVLLAFAFAAMVYLSSVSVQKDNTALAGRLVDHYFKLSEAIHERQANMASGDRAQLASERQGVLNSLDTRLKETWEYLTAEASRARPCAHDCTRSASSLTREHEKKSASQGAAPQTATLLAINDVYRIEGIYRGRRGGLARLRTLRRDLAQRDRDLILLHAGDAIFPSLVSNLYSGEQMIDVLNTLDGEPFKFDERFFATFGNHEFDKSKRDEASILSARVRQSQFTWLSANVEFVNDDTGAPVIRGQNLLKSKIIKANGLNVGIFGLTIETPSVAYVSKFEQAIETAKVTTAELRERGADIVIAITHLTLDEDKTILDKLEAVGPDLIVGGHEHTRQSYRSRGGRHLLKADADVVSALVIKITPRQDDTPMIEYEYSDLYEDSPPPDPDVDRVVARWRAHHSTLFCTLFPSMTESSSAAATAVKASYASESAPQCLDEQIGRTSVELVGEEQMIRSCETNFGNWIADQARAAFPKADVAFINAGSLRLNQNLPVGPFLRRDLEELIQYDTKLFSFTIDGATLQEVIENAISGWPGNGRWLQVSGFTFQKVSRAGKPTAEGLALIGPNGQRTTIAPSQSLTVVTTDFLLDAEHGQDGYTMLKPAKNELSEPQRLKTVLQKALRDGGSEGINPAIEGRILQDEQLCRRYNRPLRG
jgi:2',3'-cyclic-nucleotide 2'-phosphodiesterase (5'-nucleotidase family)